MTDETVRSEPWFCLKEIYFQQGIQLVLKNLETHLAVNL